MPERPIEPPDSYFEPEIEKPDEWDNVDLIIDEMRLEQFENERKNKENKQETE